MTRGFFRNTKSRSKRAGREVISTEMVPIAAQQEPSQENGVIITNIMANERQERGRIRNTKYEIEKQTRGSRGH